MNRIDNTYTNNKRTEIIAASNGGADDDLDPDERPNRSDRTDLGALKDGDDVTVGGLEVRAVCPGRGKGWFFAWAWDLFNDGQATLGQYEATNITDRAPADPNETPMPIFPEPSP